MKCRLDFVTNSSSSSFIIARKGKLSDKQKEAILDYVVERFLTGDYGETLTTIEELDSYAEENDWMDEDGNLERYHEDDYRKAKRAIEQGMSVYCGSISHEGGEDDVSDVYLDLWNIMDSNDADGNFLIINDDLSY